MEREMAQVEPAMDVAVVTSAGRTDAPHIDWGAVIGGAFLAAAISFVLLTFGSAIGLTLTSPYAGEGMSLWGFAIGAALWLVWVQVSSFMAGAYLTGRMRRRAFDSTPHESDIRDGSHGLLVWAVGIVLGAFLAVSSTSSLLGAATGVAATGVAGASTNELLTDRLLRSEKPPAQPITDEARAEIERLVTEAVAVRSVAPDDRTHLVTVVANNTGLSQADAEKRVDAIVADAKAVGEKARKIGVLIAFLTAASLMVSAAGAFFAAGIGGRHRDEQTEFLNWLPGR
jgi:hypothetical protein